LGTSELILIGIVALIFLGPRKLPEIAKKLGKIMNDLRSTTSEFKETWEREVNFDEEVKALQIKKLDEEVESAKSISVDGGQAAVDAPEVRAIDASRFEGVTSASEISAAASDQEPDREEDPNDDTADALAKQNWL